LVLVVAVLASTAAAGCATALSSFQPAHVPEPGHVHAEFGTDLSLSTGAINEVIDAAVALDDVAGTQTLTAEEMRKMLEGAASLGMNPPAIIPHAGLYYSPWENWEVGFRLATSGWRLAMRRQLLAQDDVGVDLTVGVGFGGALMAPPIGDVLDRLRVERFSRYNVDVPIAVGKHGSWYRWWGGPRVVYSATTQDMVLSLPNLDEIEGRISGHALYLGGYAGAALGYGSVFIGPELTLVELVGSADVTVLGSTTNVSIDAFIIYPAFAVMGEF
jgi:hypothetical protein